MELDIDTEAVLASFNEMHAKIEHFKAVDLGQELSAWQTEDMHRHRPFTMRWRKVGKVQTVVRPHSLYEMVRSEGALLDVKARRRIGRGLRSKLGHPLGRKFYKTLQVHRHWSMRPILRVALEQILGERMYRLLEEKLIWE